MAMAVAAAALWMALAVAVPALLMAAPALGTAMCSSQGRLVGSVQRQCCRISYK
jgi:hypothetical protein